MKKTPLLRSATPQLKSQLSGFVGNPTAVPVLEPEKQRQQKTWTAAIFAAAVLACILGGIALGFSLSTYLEVNRYSTPSIVSVSGVLNYNPYVVYLAGTGAPQTMTLPNDLTPYIGKVYRIWSLTNQPHRLQISGIGSTFTGGGTIATFGGGNGDGLVFEVISKNFIAILSNTNVVFT